jgi:hypothetical protein
MKILFDEMTYNCYETIFYPFSGADFSIIKHIHQSIPSEKLNIKNFIFCDGCLNEDPVLGNYDDRLAFLENQLGFQGFEIIEKSNFSLNQQDFITIKNDVLNSSKDNEDYTKYLSSINNEGITYYKLRSFEKDNINLFFIKSDAVSAFKFLLKNHEENQSHFGLIIKYPGNQFHEFKKSIVFKDYNPSFIILQNYYIDIDEQFKNAHFKNYILDNSDNITIEDMKLLWKNEEEKKRVSMYNKGKKILPLI